jgi:hypothetical protein
MSNKLRDGEEAGSERYVASTCVSCRAICDGWRISECALRRSRRAICRSDISRASSRTSAIVSSGMRGLCQPAAFSRCFTCNSAWSPPCQCRTAWMIAPSRRTTISVRAARRIRLRVPADSRSAVGPYFSVRTVRSVCLASPLTARKRRARHRRSTWQH